MPNRIMSAMALIIIIALYFAFTHQPEHDGPAKPGKLTGVPCYDAAPNDFRLSCFHFLPESKDSNYTARLPVTIYHPKQQRIADTAVLLLVQDMGVPITISDFMDHRLRWQTLVQQLHLDTDVIIVEQRGLATGNGQLVCKDDLRHKYHGFAQSDPRRDRQQYMEECLALKKWDALKTLTLPQLASDMLQMLEHLDYDRVVVVGHRFGGWIASEMTRQPSQQNLTTVITSPLLGSTVNQGHLQDWLSTAASCASCDNLLTAFDKQHTHWKSKPQQLRTDNWYVIWEQHEPIDIQLNAAWLAPFTWSLLTNADSISEGVGDVAALLNEPEQTPALIEYAANPLLYDQQNLLFSHVMRCQLRKSQPDIASLQACIADQIDDGDMGYAPFPYPEQQITYIASALDSLVPRDWYPKPSSVNTLISDNQLTLDFFELPICTRAVIKDLASNSNETEFACD